MTACWAPAAGIIDSEKKVRHSKLALRTTDAITEPSKLNVKLKVRHLQSSAGAGCLLAERDCGDVGGWVVG